MITTFEQLQIVDTEERGNTKARFLRNVDVLQNNYYYTNYKN